MADNVLEVKRLKKYFPVRRGVFGRTEGCIKAVDGVSFNIARGTTLGLVGESGCGKTTLGKTVLRLSPKTEGEVLLNGMDIFKLNARELRALRPSMQLIFQDPYGSLSPRLPVGELIGEAVREHGIVPKAELNAYVAHIMGECGLAMDCMARYPHEFSGGQRQRICIARALALRPEFIVCDEPVSALDVSIQAQIINLLKELQQKHGLSYLFISHDLSVVEHMSDNIGVMYLGGIVEQGKKRAIFDEPLHPYTRALLSAIPLPDPESEKEKVLEVYDPSCHHYETDKPVWTEIEDGHFIMANQEELAEYRKQLAQ